MATQARRTGDAAEALVVERLEAAGWTILGRNVRVGRAELDIVALDPGPPARLVIVEVRARRRRDFGLAEETVDHAKRRRLRGALAVVRERGSLPDGTPLPAIPARFDVVAVEPGGRPGDAPRVRHHVAAF
jgi:putative endonuclease